MHTFFGEYLLERFGATDAGTTGKYVHPNFDVSDSEALAIASAEVVLLKQLNFSQDSLPGWERREKILSRE